LLGGDIFAAVPAQSQPVGAMYSLDSMMGGGAPSNDSLASLGLGVGQVAEV